ncbi:MAG: hypothetical protein HYY51_04120 [Candidatus Magasanikbacteria bacterium]|nr:hypothetical protein [Candidatus Magasanikbacteria bacterium]
MTADSKSDGLSTDTTLPEGTGMPAARVVRRRHADALLVVRDLRIGDGLGRMPPAMRRQIEQAMLDRYGLDD